VDRASRAFIGALRRGVPALVVASVLVASCSSGGSHGATKVTGPTNADSGAKTGNPPAALDWHDCGHIECASLEVPLDWSHPNGSTIKLGLARRRADGDRIGVLLANPGGPGGSGIDVVKNADGFFPQTALDRFDIVSWDPRGVGASTPVGCGENLDYFYAVDANGTDAATARATAAVSKRFVEDCKKESSRLLPYVSTSATVRDMDAIRAALGEPKINYVGFSYGTYIGALYAQKYPNRVRTMVLDGAVDPAESGEKSVLEQAVAFDRSLDAFFRWCREDAGCKFARNGDPVAAYDSLMTSLASETLPGEVSGERRTMGAGVASIGVASALYGGREAYKDLGTALNDAARGDASKLLQFADSYTGRRPGGIYDNETAASYAIGCLDGVSPKSLAATRALAQRAARVAPRFGPSSVWLGLPCTYWPVAPVGTTGAIHAPKAPPIVVIGTTDDPATPYASAQSLAKQLRSGHLLTYIGEGHTVYGRGDECVDSTVDDYLLSLVVPKAGLRCR
jgi:pimeloyl-ACP methyl ester carboxylesterase